MSIVESKLLTIEEFSKLPDDGGPKELLRGRVIELNQPKPRHGQICSEVAYLYIDFAKKHKLGHIVTNDTGIVTERNPDSVRGADVAFYSYAHVPKGRLPTKYLQVLPEVVWEVMSGDDRWSRVLGKVAEYLTAGVPVVCVLDPSNEVVHVYRADHAELQLTEDDELILPEFSAELSVRVCRFFESP